MKNTKIYATIIAAFLILIVGNNSDGQESKPPPSKLVNIVVILDTSDRVAKGKHPNQVDKDIEITKGLVDFYYERARRKMFSTQNRLAFVVPNQPEIPSNVARDYKKSENLAHEASSTNRGKRCLQK